MFAVTQHKKLFIPRLLLVGAVCLAVLGVTTVTSVQAGTVKACLIQTVATSQWSPPSPDPMGITVLPNGHLLVSDSEVEECVNGNLPVYWQGVNLFETDTSGTLLATGTTYTHPAGSCPTSPNGTASNFSTEPTGVAIDSTGNGHFYFSDDDELKIFVVDLGPDRVYGTKDDKVTSFSTAAFGDNDPEGIAFGLGNLFVTSGSGGTPGVYQLAPGANGRFDGVPSAGDDVVVRHFSTSGFGLTDPEGVTFNSDTNTLYIVGHLDKHLVETTVTGTLLNQIDITPLDVCAPGDVIYAPSSLNPAAKHLYIVDRGVDNNDNRFANDGEVYEISIDPTECALLPQNLLLNSDFEHDCNNNTLPDKWSEDSHFTRSNVVVHDGGFAGKHLATSDASYTISQTVSGLSAGKRYTFSGWTNIPPTSDAFSFSLQVQWRNSSDSTLSTQTIKTYTAATNGWDQATASLVAPTGTTNAKVQMVANSLKATVYVDDFLFAATVSTPPTANFSGNPTSGTAPLTVQFTDQSTGTPTSWAWDFQNDGTVDSTLQNPQFTYTTPGSYTVKLTATNAAGSNTTTKASYITVTVPPPAANFSGSPTSGTAPLTVQFTDQSTGTPTSWAWDFQGDGIVDSTLQNPQFTYAAPGSYTVSLTVSNAAGSNTATKVSYITVTATPPPPAANFSGSPTSGTAPLSVQFTDQSTGNPTSWAWDFQGDGIVDSTLQNPQFTYTTPGSYTVSLTVSNTAGSNTATKVSYITVTAAPPPPTADFSGNPTSGTAPLTVQFTDQSTGNPTSWAWDFQNDGIVDSTLQNPQFTYTTPGSYTVKLTVSNGAGSNSKTSPASYITVTAPPAPPAANFSGNPTSGTAPLTVQFTDQSTGNPTSWAWDFQGDGIVDSTLQNPQFTYTTPGSYTVSLTVSNAAGSNTATKVSAITVTAPATGNLLLNPGFELAANGVNPDSWTLSSARFLRSNEVVHGGSFAGKHIEANTGRTIAQTIPNLTAGRTYSVSSWVNIPSTTTIYKYKLRVTWLDASGIVISYITFKTYTAPTVGWDNAVASMVAPAGTTQAQMQLITDNINGVVYVDDLVFQ